MKLNGDRYPVSIENLVEKLYMILVHLFPPPGTSSLVEAFFEPELNCLNSMMATSFESAITLVT